MARNDTWFISLASRALQGADAGTIYLHQGNDREAFVRTVFQRLDVQARVARKHVLLKPNIVSSEPYPTTTHPADVAANSPSPRRRESEGGCSLAYRLSMYPLMYLSTSPAGW